MNKEFFKKYLSGYETYFSNRLDDVDRIYVNLNRLLDYKKLNKIDKKCKLLDLGSGDGSFAEICRKKNIKVNCIDGSQGINFEKDKLNFEDNTFDFVIFNSVIEHLYSPNNILNEVNRILKNEGILITITPNFEYAYKKFYDDPTHVHPYTPKSLNKILNMHGFLKTYLFPNLINKPKFMWDTPLKFYLASIIPFRNHTFKNLRIPNFLRGKSTSMIAISIK
tara:strand:- start:447 stop:1112 length:666 start_codon:yes stop_codon:yes gene_type:complete